MANKKELLDVTHTMIQKVHDDIVLLQADALRFSAAGEYAKLHQTLVRQREAISAQIAMVDAARYLESD
jgi:hypothetical protein